MWLLGSGSLRWFGAHHDQARRSLAYILVVFFGLALAPSSEAPAQTAPWDIETIQHRLVDLGYDVGATDGLLGPKTHSALRAFQTDRGLLITGLPDGNTQRALFTAEPSKSAADAPTPNDDPPDLEAVPLKPVRVAPLAPLVKGKPHEGFSVELSLAVRPGETPPPVSRDRVPTLSQRDASAESNPRDRWLKWAAAALAVLGALVFFAAARPKSDKQETAVAAPPQPIPSQKPSTRATVHGGHVFGVDIPPSGDSETG